MSDIHGVKSLLQPRLFIPISYLLAHFRNLTADKADFGFRLPEGGTPSHLK